MWIKTVMEEIEAMDTKKTSTLRPRQANEEIIMILPEELKKYLLYLDMMQLEITKKKKMADETDSKKETAVICEQIDDLIKAHEIIRSIYWRCVRKQLEGMVPKNSDLGIRRGWEVVRPIVAKAEAPAAQ